jgi:cytochrome c553
MNTTQNLLFACLLAGATTASQAQIADTGAGRKRAAVCLSCHGQEGIAGAPGIPHLAGQDRAYLEKALLAYRSGQTRQDPTMTAMAKPLSDADIRNIAAFFSGLKRKP